jgi:hypothetical protein
MIQALTQIINGKSSKLCELVNLKLLLHENLIYILFAHFKHQEFCFTSILISVGGRGNTGGGGGYSSYGGGHPSYGRSNSYGSSYGSTSHHHRGRRWANLFGRALSLSPYFLAVHSPPPPSTFLQTIFPSSLPPGY